MGNGELSIFVGLQGSGKSTFFRERLAATHLWVSKDRMRNRRDRAQRQGVLIEQALREGRAVAVDNTHPRRADRAELIALGRAHRARVVGYFFDADKASCLARNALRVGRERVPDVALHVAAARLEPPTLDEGFDRLYRVRLVEGGFEVSEVFADRGAKR